MGLRYLRSHQFLRAKENQLIVITIVITRGPVALMLCLVTCYVKRIPVMYKDSCIFKS